MRRGVENASRLGAGDKSDAGRGTVASAVNVQNRAVAGRSNAPNRSEVAGGGAGQVSLLPVKPARNQTRRSVGSRPMWKLVVSLVCFTAAAMLIAW
jgi:hypothetical protein